MDPLSDVLSLLRPRSYVSAGFDAGGDWSIQFPDQNQAHQMLRRDFRRLLAVRGECSRRGPPGGGRLFRAAERTAFPARKRPDVDRLSTPVRFFRLRGLAALSRINGGGDFFLVGSRFGVSGNNAGALLGMLPPIVHIRKESDQAALRWSVERMMHELREEQPGGILVAQHLAHMMLVQALRLHLAEGSGSGVGWFFALADKRLSAAIGAMHDDPGHRWTLQELAERAGMSRSSFARSSRRRSGKHPWNI